jgi:hypothetical protein
MAAGGVLPVDMRHTHGALHYFAHGLVYLFEEWLGRRAEQGVRGGGATIPWRWRWSVLAEGVSGDEDVVEELGIDRRAIYLGAGLPSFCGP